MEMFANTAIGCASAHRFRDLVDQGRCAETHPMKTFRNSAQ